MMKQKGMAGGKAVLLLGSSVAPVCEPAPGSTRPSDEERGRLQVKDVEIAGC